MIDTGSDFSGVGAFDQALERIGIKQSKIFACDMDKYARQTYIHNYGEPKYYPENVYDREIPKTPLDIYMTSPPCQSFSLAGKRGGERDKRGTLFYNSHEFIVKNKPRYFIFENVKGLLSDDGGKTFQRWIDHLGGKTVNGNPVIFPLEDAVPYHVYYQVLNAKYYGVPQNRERIFIIGIRDDTDNNFSFPKPFHLVKRLKDVLEENVDEKYYLSYKMLDGFVNQKKDSGYINQDTQASQVHSKYSESPTLSAGTHGYANGYVQIKSATSKGYEIATDEDSINFSQPNSKTRRGRVGKGVAQTLDVECKQAVLIAAMRGRNPENNSDRTTGAPTQQTLEINRKGTSNAITTVQKDNLVIIDHRGHLNKELNIIRNGIIPTLRAESHGHQPKIVVQLNPSKESGGKQPYQGNRVYEANGISPTLSANNGGASKGSLNIKNDCQIRRLTVREVFRLMDFPDSFTWPVSDSQAFKQAGNSIVVNVLAEILKKLNL